MSSINRVTLLGHIGKMETRYTAQGICVVNISLATQEKVKNKDTNEVNYVPEWHRIVCFGKKAEHVSQNADKGTKLFVEGSLKTNKYKDKVTGQDRYSTQINAFYLEIITKTVVTNDVNENEQSKSEALDGDFHNDMDIPF